MIAGSEGIHAWTPPGASAVAVELGRVKADDGSPVWPRYTIKRVTGLGSTGDPEDNRDRPPSRGLEIPRRSERRGKTITYEGSIKARSLLQLREAEAALRAAFDGLNREGRMDVSWHPLLTAFAAEPSKFYEARALTCDVVEAQEGQGWERLYVVGVRMSDRRYFDKESESQTVEITETNAAFSTTVSLPANYRGPILDLALSVGSSEEIGGGGDPSLISLQVLFRNLTTGKSLAVSLEPTVWNGDDLTLDFYRQTIKDQTGADRSALLDPADDEMWSMAPLIAGDNDLEVEVTAVAAGVPQGIPYAAVATLRWERGYY